MVCRHTEILSPATTRPVTLRINGEFTCILTTEKLLNPPVL